MKILMINKFFFIKGGAERYFFELSDILRKHGHEVIPFAMKHPQNEPSEYEPYFADYIEYEGKSTVRKIASSLSVLGRMIFFRQAQKSIEQLILDTKPDIAHLHMIEHQLSPSILVTLKKYNIPVIQTVHQYKLVCPNYRLYNMRTSQICEKCVNSHCLHPVFERCHMDSALAGVMIGLESQIHRWMKIYTKHIDLFHVPSRFMGSKLTEGGIPEEKIQHLFYTLDFEQFKPHIQHKKYFLYYGRLAREKGILTLLKAVRKLNKPDIAFYIVGDGPEMTVLKKYVEDNGLNQVYLTGYKGGDALKEMIDHCMAVVVPSEWYDNSPLVIYEALTKGKPVIVSQMGGMPELVQEGVNGYTFTCGDADGLAQKLKQILDDPEKTQQMGRQSRKLAETWFHPDVHYDKLLILYNHIVSEKK